MNPWLLLAMGVAWAASVGLVGLHEYRAGAGETETVWQARESKENALAASQVASAQDAARKAEVDAGARLAAISTDYERRIQDAQVRHDSDVAAARRGTVVLRDPAGAPAVCPDPGGPAQAAASTSGRDDAPAGCELSRPADEVLLGIADDADRLTGQLAACQAVIRADRAPTQENP